MSKIKNKYFKKIDPFNTKPSNLGDLNDFKMKLISLSKKIHKEKFVKINKCLICKNSRIKKIFTSRKFEWMECPKCRHHQKKSMPKYEDLIKFYNEDTVENYLNEINIDYRVKNLALPKYNFIKAFIKNNKKKRWLDLASGLGDMPFLLKKKGWEVTSTEIFAPFIEFAKKKLNVIHSKILLENYFKEHSRKKNKKFDVVGALGYFDILSNPLKDAKIINQLLNKNGIIAVNIPINDSVSGALTKLFPEDSLRQITPMDFSVFSKKSIFLMLKKAGFEVVGVWHHGLDYYEMISKLIQNTKKNRYQHDDQIKMLGGLFNEMQKVIDKNKLSDLLLICAKKVKNVKP
jgi:SAM-dependent methyltransferase